jgi:hypothetical protein
VAAETRIAMAEAAELEEEARRHEAISPHGFSGSPGSSAP